MVVTYRLQFRNGFGFAEAERLLPYLRSLGVSDLYASPILRARPGSTHGYDTTDYGSIDPDLGGEIGFSRLTDAIRRQGMGLLLDFVPNHMAADSGSNGWWRDVLENGPAARHAEFFDIEWEPPQRHLQHKVLLPILGAAYGHELDAGHFRLGATKDAINGWPTLAYFDQDLPLEPQSIGHLLAQMLDAARSATTAAAAAELELVVDELRGMPTYADPSATAERSRRTTNARAALGRLLAGSDDVGPVIDDALRSVSTDPDRLHALLEQQPYRLAYWRTAPHEINYRRFFDVDGLVGVRMEVPAVFEASHAKILDLFAAGRLQGLRLDHVDGLLDPAGYLERLRADLAARGHGDAYVVVEKILTGDEKLVESWSVQGTSGYEFLNDVGRVFVDGAGERLMERVYRRFVGVPRPFLETVHTAKRLIMDGSLASELGVLTTKLDRIAKQGRATRDFTWSGLRDALEEIVACFPVYRTYVDDHGCSAADRAVIDDAVERARRERAEIEPSLFAFIRRVLVAPETQAERELVGRFQQYTGPVQAKGLEDTAFYRYTRLLSLCEVGGEPERFGAPPARFHEANAERLARWPDSMLATSTHDTKRGEDARARLSVLSEMPLEWSRHLFRWRRTNARRRTNVGGVPAPERTDEYAFYQNLLATWPADLTSPNEELVDRVSAAMVKAAREAKQRTSWLAENEEYESALAGFVRDALVGPTSARFVADFAPFAREIARLGAFSSLSQTVLKATSPGVPDFYQGSELWDLNLVDPDNRRPVDFDDRAGVLNRLEPLLDSRTSPDQRQRELGLLLDQWSDGHIKLFVTAAVLRLRARLEETFRRGAYIPLEASGNRADHVVALARQGASGTVVVAVPRLPSAIAASPDTGLRLDPAAFETTILPLPPPGGSEYSCVLTGATVSERQVSVAKLFATAPVAVLAST